MKIVKSIDITLEEMMLSLNSKELLELILAATVRLKGCLTEIAAPAPKENAEPKPKRKYRKRNVAENEALAAIADEQPDSEDAMAHLEDEPSEESAMPNSYEDEKIAHTKAQKLASKYGKNAMQGTPVVIDSKTVVIKRNKKGDKK